MGTTGRHVTTGLLVAFLAAGAGAVELTDGAGGSIQYNSLVPVRLVQTSTKSIIDSSFHEYAPWRITTADNTYSLSVGFLSFLHYGVISDEAPRLTDVSVTPSTGVPGTAFRFRAVYHDDMGDPPLTDGIRLHIREGDALVTSTAGVILRVDASAPPGTPLTGIVFSGVYVLSVPSDRYNFTIEARDAFEFSTSTARFAGPFVDTPPQLLFVRDAGYYDSFVQPHIGGKSDQFRVRVRYLDADNHLPSPGSPRVIVRRNGAVVRTQSLALTASDLPVNGMVFEGVLSSFTEYGFHECTLEASDAIGLSTVVPVAPGITVVSVPETTVNAPARPLTPGIPHFLEAVVRCDDGQPPPVGYPRAVVTVHGTSVTAGVMEHVSGDPTGGARYRFSVQLTSVSAGYRFVVQTIHPTGYGGMIVSSPVAFAVTSGPMPPVSTTVYDDPVNNVSLTSRCRLSWHGWTPDAGTTLTYRLYCGVERPSDEPVYTGSANHCTLTDLEAGQRYVWAVSATDEAGASARSAEYVFRTVALEPFRVYNYPNPFNPHRGGTSIVYHATAPGDAELRVYTERGELKYRTTGRASAGSNSIAYDGRDRDGRVLDNGSYIYTITVDGVTRTGVLLIMKRS
jgi:hypothetical protein